MTKGVPFIDAVKARHTPYRTPCSAGVAIAKMPADLRAEVLDAFAVKPGELPARAIADELTARGYPVKDQAVARHRAGRCACPSELRRRG